MRRLMWMFAPTWLLVIMKHCISSSSNKAAIICRKCSLPYALNQVIICRKCTWNICDTGSDAGSCWTTFQACHLFIWMFFFPSSALGWNVSKYIQTTGLLVALFSLYRLFGVTGNCAACSKLIPAFEMVMRARDNVYHLDCFACQLCRQR